MNALVWLAVALAVLWFFGIVFFKIVGFAIHIALIAAVILFAIWLYRKTLGSGQT